METIVNKVQQQDKLVTIDLEKYADKTPIAEFDIKNYLFKGLVLKEKEFRKNLKEFEWSSLQDKYLAVFCSADAIVAKWAYMLITAKANPYTKDIFYGDKEGVIAQLYKQRLEEIEWEQYEDKFVLLKGCSTDPVPESTYLYATKKLLPYARKIMYGEACSSVPVYSKPGK